MKISEKFSASYGERTKSEGDRQRPTEKKEKGPRGICDPFSEAEVYFSL